MENIKKKYNKDIPPPIDLSFENKIVNNIMEKIWDNKLYRLIYLGFRP